MKSTTTRVSAKELRAGMEIEEIKRLSGDFSYLDKGLVEVLKSHFPGAMAMLEKSGKRRMVAMDQVNSGDHLASIHNISRVPGLNPLQPGTVETLSRLGLEEISIRPFQSEAPGQAPSGAAGVIHTHKNRAVDKVAETLDFVEKVATGALQRDKTTASMEEMFEMARIGKSFTKVASEAVEEIVMMDISSAMAAVSGLKSSGKTYSHCVDMAVILEEITRRVIEIDGGEVSDTIARSTLAAGFMHDIGKSAVPSDIIDSTDWYPPNGKEIELVRSHPEKGAKIISDAGMDETMVNVALCHHVMPNSSLPNSYPNLDFSQVKPMTRLAGVVDAYQSMISNGHREKMVPGKAVQQLRLQTGMGFDMGALNKFLKVIGQYPVGTLVRLTTGDLAFVTKFSADNPSRPMVVVAENAQGELLSHNPIIDLIEHKDITIRQILDHNLHYNESENQALEIFSGLRVD